MAEPVYMPHQDKTYVYNGRGDLVTVLPGNQTAGPQVDFAARSAVSGAKGSPGGKVAEGQNTKDFLVNLASQAPLAIPGLEGVPGLIKGAASLATGFGADRLLNSDKSIPDSLMDSGINTAVAGITNHLIQNPPSISNFSKGRGWGVKGILDGLVKTMMGEPILTPIPPQTPVNRGAGGRFTSNISNYNDYKAYLAKKGLLNMFSNSAGLGVNTGIDAASNSQ